MDRQQSIRTGVAAAVAATGLLVGGVAVASADDTDTSTTTAERQERGPGHRGGPGLGDPAALADALGVSEDDLTAAMDEIREERGDDRPAAGERPDPAAEQAELAAALAEKLGVTEEDVTAALADQREAAEADHRDRLSERLDTAVEDGDLTEADRASVLKAFDAGVLDGPGGR